MSGMTRATISEVSKAICALDCERSALDKEAAELAAKLSAVIAKRDAVDEAIVKLWRGAKCL